LVPDEDVLVFNDPDAAALPTINVSPLSSPTTASLGLVSIDAAFEAGGTRDDVADLDPNLPVLDDIDLIGLTSDSGLSHDLYV